MYYGRDGDGYYKSWKDRRKGLRDTGNRFRRGLLSPSSRGRKKRRNNGHWTGAVFVRLLVCSETYALSYSQLRQPRLVCVLLLFSISCFQKRPEQPLGWRITTIDEEEHWGLNGTNGRTVFPLEVITDMPCQYHWVHRLRQLPPVDIY